MNFIGGAPYPAFISLCTNVAPSGIDSMLVGLRSLLMPTSLEPDREVPTWWLLQRVSSGCQ